MQTVGVSVTKYFQRLQTVVTRRTITKKYLLITNVAFSKKYLLLTNVGLSITLSGLGDYLEQKYEIYCGQIDEYSLKRTTHMSISGMILGVICHNWYKFLDKRLPPQRTFKVAIKKLFIDQLIGSPIFLTAFFITMAILEQSTFEEFKAELKEKAIQLYTAEWVVWPPAQMINFYFIPLQYRVLFDNLVSLGYDVYTSHIKHFNEGKTKKNQSQITDD